MDDGLSADPETKTERGGTMPPCHALRDWYESDESSHPNKRSAVFISRPPKLHFTLNHYTLGARFEDLFFRR
jgi:hypothetical protein